MMQPANDNGLGVPPGVYDMVQAARFLKNRITAFLSLPLASIDRMALEQNLRQIGRMEGSTGTQGKIA